MKTCSVWSRSPCSVQEDWILNWHKYVKLCVDCSTSHLAPLSSNHLNPADSLGLIQFVVYLLEQTIFTIHLYLAALEIRTPSMRVRYVPAASISSSSISVVVHDLQHYHYYCYASLSFSIFLYFVVYLVYLLPGWYKISKCHCAPIVLCCNTKSIKKEQIKQAIVKVHYTYKVITAKMEWMIKFEHLLSYVYVRFITT